MAVAKKGVIPFAMNAEQRSLHNSKEKARIACLFLASDRNCRFGDKCDCCHNQQVIATAYGQAAKRKYTPPKPGWDGNGYAPGIQQRQARALASKGKGKNKGKGKGKGKGTGKGKDQSGGVPWLQTDWKPGKGNTSAP